MKSASESRVIFNFLMSADALESFSSGRASDAPIPSDVGPDPEPTVTRVMTNFGPVMETREGLGGCRGAVSD